MTAPTCALCGVAGDIRQSHVIPKFAINWIKRTSLTGRLASATDAAKRIQDGIKISLLCDNCEEIFSKAEKYFAEKIFTPFHDNGVRLFDYNKNLEHFATSLSWRSLKVSYDEAVRDHRRLISTINRAEVCWREFLRGRRESIQPYENHLIFTGDQSNCEKFRIDKWYNSRSVDSTLVVLNEALFSYSLIPRMIFVTSIRPVAMDGWRGTLIKKCGKIGVTQNVSNSNFWNS